jgi:hypothetical protein
LVGRWKGKAGIILLLTKVSLTIASRSGAEYSKTETVLKYALRKFGYLVLLKRGKGWKTTDRFPANGSDDGKRVKNSRNGAEDTVIGSSGIERKSSKRPDGGSGPS